MCIILGLRRYFYIFLSLPKSLWTFLVFLLFEKNRKRKDFGSRAEQPAAAPPSASASQAGPASTPRQQAQRASQPAHSPLQVFFSPARAHTPASPSPRGHPGPARQRLPCSPHPPFPSPLAVAMGTASMRARELAPLTLAPFKAPILVPCLS